MVDVPLVPLSFIAGPAVVANACAIMQNGASIRYSLAVQQLRELRTRAQVMTLPSLYEDPRRAAQLSETRVLALLRQAGTAIDCRLAVRADQCDGSGEFNVC